MTEAMQRYHEEYNKTTTKPDILEYLAFSTYMEGNIRRALQMTNELLELQPNHERAIGNKVCNDRKHNLKIMAGNENQKISNLFNQVYYEGALKTESGDGKKRGEDGEAVTAAPRKPLYEGHEAYETLCRSETGLSEAYKSKLTCRFVELYS